MKFRIPILLLLIHVPFLIGYMYGLGTDSVYQFGPVAWCIVGLLCCRRTAGELQSTSPHSVVHFLADIFCVSLFIVTGEFVYGLLGGLIWLHVLLSQYREKSVNSSLSYLCVILFFTVRLPTTAADRVLQELDERAARLASWCLDQFHYLHVATWDSIEVAGHSFLIDEICSDMFSLPALVCISCIFMCIMHRRRAHAIPSLAVCSGIAIVMQAAKLYATVAVWQHYGPDAPFGATLNASVFALGVIVVISCDVLVSVFTEPVPLMATSMINPFAMLWNRLFLPPSEHGAEGNDKDAGLSDVFELMKESPSVPGMLVPWTTDFLFTWFTSRSQLRVMVGLPCLALLIAGGVLRTNAESLEEINNRYEVALTEAMDTDRKADLVLAMERLQQSDVDSFAIRFRQAQKQISLGSKEDAIAHIKALTPVNGRGYVPARIWLVKQSGDEDALIPLNEEERQQQLRKAIQEHGLNVDAHLLLARGYVRQRQTRLAELHFTTAVELEPKHAPELLLLQQALGRSRQELASYAAAAVEELKDRLSDQRNDHEARISLARVTAILGDVRAAESILQTGLDIEESKEVKIALSGLCTEMARDLAEQPLNHDQAKELVLKAILLNPANRSAINILFRTVQPTGTMSPLALRPALDHWRQLVDGDATSVQGRVSLMQLLTLCGRFDKAIEVLKPVVAENADFQANLARLYVLADRPEEAREVTDALLTQLRSSGPEGEQMLVAMARVLLIEQRWQEVVELMETQFIDDNRIPGTELAGIYVSTLNAIFDQKAAADDSFAGTNESLNLLRRVHQVNPDASSIASRLARIAVGTGDAAAEANTLVLKILAQGKVNAAMYSAVGAQAILHDDVDKAVVNLEQADALAPNDPVTLNNLAVALVRQSRDNADRALSLVERTLAIAPGHIEVLATRGEVYIALNRLSDARKDLLEVLNRDSKHELALRLLAGIAD